MAPVKTAIILMTMGGPDNLDAVRPFLFNLFNDPAIINLPQPFRFLLASLISRRRAPHAQEIYAKMGGKSPIFDQTKDQAATLEKRLSKDFIRCFVAMRYWTPLTAATIEEVRQWGAERIVLLPMYPQFSTTTSQSSCKEWLDQCAKLNWFPQTETIISYADNLGFITANQVLIQEAFKKAPSGQPVRLLFSAHGLPVSVVEKRQDPYPRQVEDSTKAVMASFNDQDFSICYQSRVGPMQWIGPATPDEIARAGQDGKGIILIPISFVCEHSETLVELDIDYAELAKESGVPFYIRVPTVGIHDEFIGGLAQIIKERLKI